MRSQSETFVHFIVALPAEAKPLVNHYRLKRRVDEDAFPVFEKEGISLTVSGIGKVATASAIGYTHVLFGKRKNAVWLNVGVAGHREHPVGSVWIAHKITDAETGQRWYPSICFRARCPSAEIRTVSRPETAYARECLYDMEAAAFFEAASRFSSAELVHCLKVISDNRQNVVGDIDPARVTAWVENAVAVLLYTKQALRHLAGEIASGVHPDLQVWSSRWRFTAQERRQLEKLLHRWRVLSNDRPLPDVPRAERGRDILRWLKDAVERLPVRLNSPPP